MFRAIATHWAIVLNMDDNMVSLIAFLYALIFVSLIFGLGIGIPLYMERKWQHAKPSAGSSSLGEAFPPPHVQWRTWSKYGKFRLYVRSGKEDYGYIDVHTGDIKATSPRYKGYIIAVGIIYSAVRGKDIPRLPATVDIPERTLFVSENRPYGRDMRYVNRLGDNGECLVVAIVDVGAQQVTLRTPEFREGVNRYIAAISDDMNAKAYAFVEEKSGSRIPGGQLESASKVKGASDSPDSFFRGAMGEAFVAGVVEQNQNPPGAQVIYGYRYPQWWGDIDIVVVNRSGIFLLSVKTHENAKVQVQQGDVVVNGIRRDYVSEVSQQVDRLAQSFPAFRDIMHGLVVMPFLDESQSTFAEGTPVFIPAHVNDHLAAFPPVMDERDVDFIVTELSGNVR